MISYYEQNYYFCSFFTRNGLVDFIHLFIVDQRQFALVFALGEIKKVINEPGLYFKLPQPLQNIIYLEKRTLTIDTPDADRFITKKQNVVVDTYVKWRIDDAKLFYTSVAGRVASANDRISRALRDGLNNEIATRTVNDVISGEREEVMESVTRRVAEDATQIGVRIVDGGLEKLSLQMKFGTLFSEDGI